MEGLNLLSCVIRRSRVLNAEIILIKTLKTFLCVFICGCSYFSC